MKFSVIIPAYNSEQYLQKCVNSILSGNSDPLEILIIDDGSADQTYSIIQKLHENDPRILPFHEDNNGPSTARNLGIQKATGDYILFVDSDDQLIPGSLNRISSVINDTHADVIISRMLLHDADTNQDIGLMDPHLNLNRIDPDNRSVSMDEMGSSHMTPSPCRYVIKRELVTINHLYFKEHIQHEDTLWTPQMLCKAQSFAPLQEPFYKVFSHAGSRNDRNRKKRLKSLLDVCEELIELLQKETNTDNQLLLERFLCNDLCYLMREYGNLSTNERKKLNLKNWFHDNNQQIQSIARQRTDLKILSKIIGPYSAFAFHGAVIRAKNGGH